MANPTIVGTPSQYNIMNAAAMVFDVDVHLDDGAQTIGVTCVNTAQLDVAVLRVGEVNEIHPLGLNQQYNLFYPNRNVASTSVATHIDITISPVGAPGVIEAWRIRVANTVPHPDTFIVTPSGNSTVKWLVCDPPAEFTLAAPAVFEQ